MSASVPTMGSSPKLGTSVGLKQGLKRQPSVAGFKEAWAQPIPPSYLPNGASVAGFKEAWAQPIPPSYLPTGASVAGFKEAWTQPIPPSYLPNGADYVFNSKVIEINT